MSLTGAPGSDVDNCHQGANDAAVCCVRSRSNNNGPTKLLTLVIVPRCMLQKGDAIGGPHLAILGCLFPSL